MKRNIELLAPGGDIDAAKTAILSGADAVYCGLNKFNARNRAANIGFDDLQGILRLAKQYDCKVFLTLNIVILDSEVPLLIKLLNRIVNTTIDGVIIQDFGLFYMLSKYFKSLKIHASTQLTTHNSGQIRFLSQLKAERVNLSRELNLAEIKELTTAAHNNNMLSEVFVHGSYCVSFSGICYMSSLQGNNSGNRGKCSQPCRERYQTTSAGKNYPLNLKDNSAFSDLRELYEVGVDSLKIEGRIKEFDYVYTVVDSWRKQLNQFYKNDSLNDDDGSLYTVFNREFSNSFLKGDINKDMFIDDPMSQSTKHLSVLNKYSSNQEMLEGHKEHFEIKNNLKATIKNKIDQFTIAKIPLSIHVSGSCGKPLKVVVQMPDSSFDVYSAVQLSSTGTEALSYNMLLQRFKTVNDLGYLLEKLIFNSDSAIYLPFKELNSIKKKLLFILNNSKELIPTVNVPVLADIDKTPKKPKLTVLIDSIKDIDSNIDNDIDLCFQLPDSMKHTKEAFIALFVKNTNLIPWFPSVIIGEDYLAAVEFLHNVKPKRIVSNNTGIAYEASKMGIEWIAGPGLNITNSYSLTCLKESFNCKGAFLSNEISNLQRRFIKKPTDFDLFCVIYQPTVLMTSRQCLFHTVTGCEKHKIDDSCIQQCEKSASISNIKDGTFIIHKTKGNYHRVYNDTNQLNTDIVKDAPHLFSSFLIDLRNVSTKTKIKHNKATIIQLFKQCLKGDPNAVEQLNQAISPSVNVQIKQGF